MSGLVKYNKKDSFKGLSCVNHEFHGHRCWIYKDFCVSGEVIGNPEALMMQQPTFIRADSPDPQPREQGTQQTILLGCWTSIPKANMQDGTLNDLKGKSCGNHEFHVPG